jgi:hypothetical protein
MLRELCYNQDLYLLQTALVVLPPDLVIVSILDRLPKTSATLSPSILASLRNIPTKYDIIAELWTYTFQKVLESLCRAAVRRYFFLNWIIYLIIADFTHFLV